MKYRCLVFAGVLIGLRLLPGQPATTLNYF